jgi:DNA-binding response OmpR family regulator
MLNLLVVSCSIETIDEIRTCFRLRWPDCAIQALEEPQAALPWLEHETPDMILLDTSIPQNSAYLLSEQIRQRSDAPLIFLGAEPSETHVARALESGADDYIKKPFMHIELLARANAVLRRSKWSSAKQGVRLVEGSLSMELGTWEVLFNSKRIKLTPIEFAVLYHLVKNADTVIQRDELLLAAWGSNNVLNPKHQHLRVHIQHLRQKLGDDPTNPRIIVTQWRTGYKYNKQTGDPKRRLKSRTPIR